MIKFSKHSGIFTLEAEQIIPIDINESWSFFSNPHNLSKITPKDMGFKVTSNTEEFIYSGQIITYKVNPFPGISSNWVSEIKNVERGKFFIDTQKIGPYKLWHHEHHFEPNKNGTKIIDKITYAVPFGVIGRLIEPIIVRPRLRSIFNHRIETLNRLFS